MLRAGVDLDWWKRRMLRRLLLGPHFCDRVPRFKHHGGSRLPQHLHRNRSVLADRLRPVLVLVKVHWETNGKFDSFPADLGRTYLL